MRHVVVVALLACSAVVLSSADPPAKPEPGEKVAAPQPAPATKAWRDDPAARVIFFAVLEGLYEDGVPDEVVDLIVPRVDAKQSVKRSFVFRCPMCHAAFEAFRLYQRRQAFLGAPADEKRSTFGDGKVAKGLIEQLKAKDPQTRVYAMGAMLRPWIKRKLARLRLPDAEMKSLIQLMEKHAASGNALFFKLRNTKGSPYQEWMFYGGCQACEAVDQMRRERARQAREEAGKK